MNFLQHSAEIGKRGKGIVKKRQIGKGFFVLLLVGAALGALFLFLWIPASNRNKTESSVHLDENFYYQELDQNQITYHEGIGRTVSNELILQTVDVEQEEIEKIVKQDKEKL